MLLFDLNSEFIIIVREKKSIVSFQFEVPEAWKTVEQPIIRVGVSDTPLGNITETHQLFTFLR